jgi:putative ABC transport system permease protein
MRTELRFALRLLRRSPGFAAASILLLSLGIGASTAVFCVLKGAVLEAWPYRDFGRIVTVGVSYPRMAQERLEPLSVPEALDIERQTSVFSATMIGTARNVNLAGGGAGAERIHGAALSAGAFPMLGIAPALGRCFGPAEDRPGTANVVVLSDRLWRRRFGGDPGLVGKVVSIEGVGYTVIGVMPAKFAWWDADLYFPLKLDRGDRNRSARSIYLQGILRTGISIRAAEQALDALARRWEAEAGASAPEYRGARFRLDYLRDDVLRDLKPALGIVMFAVLLVFGAAGANVAHLYLSRVALRRREFAVRRALGAGRALIARQLLAESIVVAGLSLVCSLPAVRVLLPPMLARIPYGFVPAEARIQFDAETLGVGIALAALAAALIFALLSRAVRVADATASGPASTDRTSRGFLAAQVSVAVVVLAGAALVAGGLRRMLREPTGIRPDGAVTMRVALAPPRTGGTGNAATFEEIARRLAEIPEVTSVGAISSLPLSGAPAERLVLDGRSERETGIVFEADSLVTAGRYFEAARIALRHGRLFDSRDDADGPAVAIVSQAMARRFWPGDDPVGRRFRPVSQANGPWKTVIGVVADVRQDPVAAAARPAYYVPVGQARPGVRSMAFIEVSDRPEAAVADARRRIAGIDPEAATLGAQDIRDIARNAFGGRRFAALLLAVFAAAGLALSLAGIISAVALAVARRTREIGVRMALGSSRRGLVLLFLRETAAVCGAGVAAGFVAACGSGLLLARVLPGARFSPVEPLGAGVILVAGGLVAAYFPARRAARIDPMAALRSE